MFKIAEIILVLILFIPFVYLSNKLGESIFAKKRNRGFEKVSEPQWNKDLSKTIISYKNNIGEIERNNEEISLPKRATNNSAGYDVFSPFSFILKPSEEIKIPTGFKAYMNINEKLVFHTRSGNGFKYIRLANSTGIGDSDYFNCDDNEGHYWVKIRNEGNEVFEVRVGDGIAQCIFEEYLLADNDNHDNGQKRLGGFGSTDKK